MDKEIKILILEAARYRVLLEYAIEGLQGKSVMRGDYLGNYLQSRIDEIDEEIKLIKQQ